MNIKIGETALVTTSEWFIAPDGRSYKAVFGTVKGIFDSEKTLGVRTNAKSTNWYLEIGNMTIAGCQIHYAVKTDECNFGRSMGNWSADAANGISEYSCPSSIYFAD